jgi:divinyl chlorophyllide a 8-vinyl-reductase
MAKRVLLIGATGTAGHATAHALRTSGHDVICYGRSDPRIEGVSFRHGHFEDPVRIAAQALQGAPFDAVVSCLASRTGAPADAWTIDHRAHLNVLQAAQSAGVSQFVLLSAICVQKPKLAFQHAKLAFEEALIGSGLTWSIVRPTAFFKSLSGQIDRLRAGKPFLLFGDGALTACKPISDADLGRYMADCLTTPDRHNRILPIGGPGPAITPRQQGAELFRLLDMPARYRHVPVGLLSGVQTVLRLGGHLSPALADKAELAAIGHYYATESMLVWNAGTGRYDADATPETGADTLFDFYARLVAGQAKAPRGDHAVF